MFRSLKDARGCAVLHRRLPIAMLPLLALLSCAGERLELSQTEERRGLRYAAGSERPFSGVVYTLHEGSDQLETESRYRRGLRHGTSAAYYESGRRSLEERYRKGKLQGDRTEWYESGGVKRKEQFVDGQSEGSLREWTEALAIVEEP